MFIFSPLIRRPRLLALAAATLLLHYVAIGWVSANVRPLADRQEPEPAVIKAQLRAPVAPAPAVAAPPPPKPAGRKGRAVQAVAPEVAPAPVEAVPEPAAPEPEPQAEQPAPPEPVAEPAPEPKVEPAPLEGRTYKVALLPSATLSMDVARKDAKGAEHTGTGSMAWNTDGATYTISVEAGMSLVVTRLNLLVSTSEGSIDAAGLAPLKFTEKRLNRAQTATHFRRDEGKITFSASERTEPLAAGAQDKASVPFQLAGIGRADPAQLAGEIDIQVGSEKEADVYRFVMAGEEDLDTPAFGVLRTVHLVRPPKPGSYNSRLDLWFAPSLGWYPVLIRNTEANGAVTTQAVTKIETNGK